MPFQPKAMRATPEPSAEQLSALPMFGPDAAAEGKAFSTLKTHAVWHWPNGAFLQLPLTA